MIRVTRKKERWAGRLTSLSLIGDSCGILCRLEGGVDHLWEVEQDASLARRDAHVERPLVLAIFQSEVKERPFQPAKGETKRKKETRPLNLEERREEEERRRRKEKKEANPDEEELHEYGFWVNRIIAASIEVRFGGKNDPRSVGRDTEG